MNMTPLTSFSASRSPFRKSTFLVYSVRTSGVGLLKKTQVAAESHYNPIYVEMNYMAEHDAGSERY